MTRLATAIDIFLRFPQTVIISVSYKQLCFCRLLVITKLKLLESELQAEAEAAKIRSAKIAQRWGGTSQTHNGRTSEAASSKNE